MGENSRKDKLQFDLPVSYEIDIKEELRQLTGIFTIPLNGSEDTPVPEYDDCESPRKTTKLVNSRENTGLTRDPTYNPLDKDEDTVLPVNKSRTYPYCKPETITTEEMRAVKKTNLGVIPPRETLKIHDLNVMMEGRKNPPKASTYAQKPPPCSRQSKLSALTPRTTAGVKSSGEARKRASEPKPAILPSTGTTSAIVPSERPKPPSRPISQFSSKSRASNKSRRPPGTKETMRTHALDEEGELLVDDEEDEEDAGALPGDEQGGEAVTWRGERTVDEIISDLRAMQKVGPVKKTDTDRKMSEVIERIKFRSREMGMEFLELPQTPVDDREFAEDDEDEDGIGSEIPPEEVPREDTLLGEEGYPEGAEDVQGSHRSGSDSHRSSRDEAEEKSATGTLVSGEGENSAMADSELENLYQDMRQQAIQDLKLDPRVTAADIINIRGAPPQFNTKQPSRHVPVAKSNVYSDAVSFLSTWIPNEKAAGDKREAAGREPRVDHPSIHHFCAADPGLELPFQLQPLSIALHAPSKYHLKPDDDYKKENASDSSDPTKQEAFEAAAAENVFKAYLEEGEDGQAEQAPLTEREWRLSAEAVIRPETPMKLEGAKIQLSDPISRQFWTPAPPKMNLPPGYIQQTLFSEFQSSAAVAALPRERWADGRGAAAAANMFADDSDSSDGEHEDHFSKISVVRRTKSEADLYFNARQHLETKLVQANEDDLRSKTEYLHELAVKEEQYRLATKEAMIAGRKAPERHQMKRVSHSATRVDPNMTPDERVFWEAQRSRARKYSHGDMRLEREHQGYSIPTDVNVYLDEVQQQRERILAQKKAARNKPPSTTMGATSVNFDDAVSVRTGDKPATTDKSVKFNSTETEVSTAPSKEPKRLLGKKWVSAAHAVVASKRIESREMSDAEKSRKAAMKYNKKTTQGKKQKHQARSLKVTRFLAAKVRPLKRSSSAEPQKVPLVNKTLRVSHKLKNQRRSSLPRSDLIPFDDFLKDQGYNENTDPELEDPYDFCLETLWYKWFEEKYPPTVVQQAKEEERRKSSAMSFSPRQSETTTDVTMDIDTMEAIESTLENQVLIGRLNEKVEELTNRIDSHAKTTTYDLIERGAILRKLGRLKEAYADLTEAIEREEKLVDGYWHRHLIYLVQGKHQLALEDLNQIIRINKSHSNAYRSRGDIYRTMEDLSMAVVNYSQAIKLNQNDHMAYYNRAEAYRARREMLLANEDYATASRLCPSLTDAKFKHGLYYFNSENYQAAIYDFNDIMKQDASNAQARLYRGRAFAKMGNWKKAVEDMSAAIHLNPENALAFYYRGCLLRGQYPKLALQDFSVSLLIDDSYDNRMSFLHRGVLYMSMDRHEDALLDFASVLQLDKDLACAHCNMGVIHMTRLGAHDRAIKHFSDAIKSQPNYIRAYICRAEAYEKSNQLKAAIVDYSRAIHMDPSNRHYYIKRGHALLKANKTAQAAFAVRQATEVADMTTIPLDQQSLLYTFLKDHKKAVAALTQAARSKPIPATLSLLGKAQMRAGLFPEAIRSFSKAIEVLTPWHHKQKMPPESADIFCHLGLSHLELGENQAALQALNQSLAVKPRNPLAYHARGIVRVRLRQLKSAIFDFNKSLLLNPQMWQSYLSRACYYAMKGRYSKAVLSCNEALKLKKDNVRGYLYRAAFKYMSREYEHALEDVQAAIHLDNRCSQAYFNQGICHHTLRNYTAALKSYSIVLLLESRERQKVYINRGLLYFEMEDYENALKDFYEAFRENPEGAKIGHTLGLCYHKQRQYQRAVDAYSEAIAADPFFIDAYIGRGNVYMDLGTEHGFKMARYDYSKALMLKPDCPAARVNLAYNLQVTGKFRQAWGQFNTAVALNPEFTPALEGRAVVSLQMGESFAAIQDLNAAIKVKPSAELYTNRGVVFQFMRDLPNAMKNYQHAVRVDPTYSLAYFNAANLYFHNRQFRQANEYFCQAVRHNRKDDAAFLNRAICRVMLQDSVGALRDFDLAIELNPYAAHAFFNRGNLHASMRNYQLADQDYTKALELQPADALALKRRADVRGKLGKRQAAIEDYQRAIDIQIKLETLDLIPNANVLK